MVDLPIAVCPSVARMRRNPTSPAADQVHVCGYNPSCLGVGDHGSPPFRALRWLCCKAWVLTYPRGSPVAMPLPGYDVPPRRGPGIRHGTGHRERCMAVHRPASAPCARVARPLAWRGFRRPGVVFRGCHDQPGRVGSLMRSPAAQVMCIGRHTSGSSGVVWALLPPYGLLSARSQGFRS